MRYEIERKIFGESNYSKLRLLRLSKYKYSEHTFLSKRRQPGQYSIQEQLVTVFVKFWIL